MSACAVLVIRVLAFVLGPSLLRIGLLRISLLCIRGSRIRRLSIRGLSARPPLWREFSAHERPRANEKGDTDNRRRGERGEILQHESYLDLLVSHGQPVAVTATALYPPGTAARRGPSCGTGSRADGSTGGRTGRAPAARHGVPAGVGGRQAEPSRPKQKQAAKKTLTTEAACGCFLACSA